MNTSDLLALVAAINEADYDLNQNDEWPICLVATGTRTAVVIPQMRILSPDDDDFNERTAALLALHENVTEQCERFSGLRAAIDSLLPPAE